MSLLKQNSTKKNLVEEKVRQIDFDSSNNKGKKYEIEAIRDSTVYVRESAGHLLEL